MFIWYSFNTSYIPYFVLCSITLIIPLFLVGLELLPRILGAESVVKEFSSRQL